MRWSFRHLVKGGPLNSCGRCRDEKTVDPLTPCPRCGERDPESRKWKVGRLRETWPSAMRGAALRSGPPGVADTCSAAT